MLYSISVPPGRPVKLLNVVSPVAAPLVAETRANPARDVEPCSTANETPNSFVSGFQATPV